jgi:hypothetical protein
MSCEQNAPQIVVNQARLRFSGVARGVAFALHIFDFSYYGLVEVIGDD